MVTHGEERVSMGSAATQ